MKLLKKCEILNNDVYILGVSKDYIIVNNNYNGVSVYDKKFNFLQSIEMSSDLLLYQVYSSMQNNYFILLDVDNGYIYVLDAPRFDFEVNEFNNDRVFLNYYYVKEDVFCLKDSEYDYYFSYNGGKLLSKNKNTTGIVICNNQEQIIYKDGEKFIHAINNTKESILLNYSDDYNIVVGSNHIFAFNGSQIYIYRTNHFKKIWSVSNSYLIRSIQLSDKKIYILLNSIVNDDISIVEIYDIVELNDMD